jgi:hypothetical protein
VGINVDHTLGMRVTPESVADFKNQVADDTKASLQQSIPGIEFGALPTREPTSTVQPQAQALAEPQWQKLTFEPKEEPPPPAPLPEEQAEKRGFLHNLGRRVTGRAAQILADATFNLSDTVGDMVPEWMNAGIVFDEKGVRFESGEEYDKKSFVGNVAEVLRDPEYQIVESEETRSFEDIKASYKQGEVAKLAGDIAIYGFETGVTSIADMIAITTAAPSYFLGLTSKYTQERVANDGRKKPTVKDLAYGTGTALVVSALEKFGADKVLGMLGDGSKKAMRKFMEGVAAETLTEAVQSPTEFAGTRMDTAKQGELTAANLGEQSLAGALGGAGGGAVIGGTVQGLQALRGGSAGDPAAGPPPASAAAPSTQASNGPGQPSAATSTSTPTGTTTAPTASAGVVAGGVTLYQPQGAAAPTPVRIEAVSPDGKMATVTSLDANGEPVVVDGEPATYPVQVTDLGAPKPVAKPAAPQVQSPAADRFAAEEARAAQAPKTGINVTTLAPPSAEAPSVNAQAPTNPAGVPDAPSAEPLKDIVAQIADMKDPANPRQGVFLSHENVKNLNGLKLLGKAKELGVPAVNFDFAGGLMLFPDEAAKTAALEARKGKKKAELQALIGQLTGAGTNKPVGPGLVVQQVTPEGAVTRESLVAPADVQATATALAQEGRTVQVVTPEVAQERRAEGVAADNASIATSDTPPAAPAPDPARVEQRSKLSKLPAGGSAQLRQVLSFVRDQDKPGEGRKKMGLEQRQQNASMLSAGLKVPFSRAIAAGVLTDQEVEETNRVIRATSKLDDKSEYDTKKSKGTDHARVTSKLNDLYSAAERVAERLEKHEQQNVTQEPKAQSTVTAKSSNNISSKKSGKTKVQVTPAMKAKAYVAEDAPKIEPTTEAVVLEPREIEGKELKNLFKDIGWDPDSIVEQAQKAGGSKRAGRGALGRELERYLPEINKPGSWLQYMAALRTTDKLTDGQKHTIWKAALAFSKAAKPGPAMDALMAELQGLRLDPKTIQAIAEYSNFLRAFEKLREQMDDFEAEELVNDDGIDIEEPPAGFDDGRELNIPSGARTKINMALINVATGLVRNGFYNKLVADFRDKQRFMGTHEFLKRLLDNMDKTQDTFFVSLIERLLKTAPDVPIKFETQLTDANRGFTVDPALAGSTGVFVPRKGLIQLVTPDKITGEFIQTALHEITHAATSLELNANPNGELNQKLTKIRSKAYHLAVKRYGKEVVEANLNYLSGKGEKPAVYMRELYGLTNNHELITETFTNPNFQQLLLDLGAMEPHDSPLARKTFLQRIMQAITEWLGARDPRSAWLLQMSVDMSAEAMRAQYNRAQEDKAQYNKIVTEFAAMFEVDEATARERIRDTFKGVDILEAYTAGPQRLAQNLAQDAEVLTIQQVLRNLPTGNATPPLRNEATIRALAGDTLTGIARATRNAGKTQAAEKVRKGFLSLYTFDQIERRMSRFFGTEGSTNPLTRLMDVRRTRQSHANVVLEHAEKDVNAKWLKLNSKESKQLGQIMIDATLWSIDPSKPKDAQPPKVTKRKDFDKRYAQLQSQWVRLNHQQRDVFNSARDFNTYLFKKIRRAAVDLALDGFTETEITKPQRAVLYTMRTPEDVDNLVGAGKLVNIGEMNDQFSRALKDLMRVTRIEGPYFSLRRYGDKVVQAKREGEEVFNSEGAAKARVEEIKDMTPANKAKVVAKDGKYTVEYKINYVSFHNSRRDAEADASRLQRGGFSVEPVTEKTTSVVSPALTPALKEMLSAAQRKLGGEGEGRAAISFALENAFAQILAERAASVASELKREGFAGVKPEEMHIGFAERTHSTAWHYANLVTAKEEVRALTNLRGYARDASQGNADQKAMYQRGLVANEVERRIGIEAQDFGQSGPVDSFFGKIGFMNFLMTPSYTFVNSMQNFTVAMPTIGARYGYGRTSKAFARSMRAVAGPAFGKAIRGMVRKPGQVNSYDIYQAIHEGLKDDPRLAKWVQGDNSAIKQLVDLGVINASFTQELMSVAEGESRTARKAMEYARLMPQGAEMFNRISTSLAALELTKGDVNKTADLVRLTQIDYSHANQPRAFRRIGRVSLPRSLTMFKMYPQAIYNLIIGSTYDAITGAGMPRAQAAKTLAGLLVSHTVLAGVIGGLLIEPLRLILWSWNQLFGDDDEQYDLDSSVRLWMADTFGKGAGDVLSRGVFNALGIDLSTRLGLNHLAFYNPPDLTKADEAGWYKTIAEALGPIPSMIARNHTAFMKAWERGRFRDALASLIPIKIVQDANKAWNMVNEGITTSSGEPIIPADELNAAHGVAKFLGFRTTAEANVQDKRSTKFNYEEWLGKRKSQLYNFYWNAADAEERRKAVGAIKQFNEKNPGAAIRMEQLLQNRRAAKQQAAQVRGEMIRNPDLRKKLAY